MRLMLSHLFPESVDRALTLRSGLLKREFFHILMFIKFKAFNADKDGFKCIEFVNEGAK